MVEIIIDWVTKLELNHINGIYCEVSVAFTKGTLFVKVTVGGAEHPNFPRHDLHSLVKISIHVDVFYRIVSLPSIST